LPVCGTPASNRQRRRTQGVEIAFVSQLLCDLRDALPNISHVAVDTIVTFEVSNEALRYALYRHPVWTGLQSDVTVGIGCDLGYLSASQFATNWSVPIGKGAAQTLISVCGLKGLTAQQELLGVASMDVLFDASNKVFRNTALQRTMTQTIRALPNASHLKRNCLGALVSLVYNRGVSFSLTEDAFGRCAPSRRM